MRPWLLAGVLIVIAAGGLWWWNHQWELLEAGLNTTVSAQTEKPQAQVPAEVMQRLLLHRVEPVYPAEARTQNVQGVIALSIVVGRDGSVLSMRALNGPDVLARAAMDALRWWKFEPYRLNGEPAAVETTVAVECKQEARIQEPQLCFFRFFVFSKLAKQPCHSSRSRGPRPARRSASAWR